jgi:hypothetical protein
MQEEIHRLALATLRRHAKEAGAVTEFDEGELVVNGHRLGLSVGCDGVTRQGGQVIVPLDIQIHLDGDSGDKFRLGTLGIGDDRETAARAAVVEWHLLAADPVLAALGAPLAARRNLRTSLVWGPWSVFPGRAGVRGPMPPALQTSGALLGDMLGTLRAAVLEWPDPSRWLLRSMFVMATIGPDSTETQAAVDGFVDESLAEKLAKLSWPRPREMALYKQLLVLQAGSD